MVIKSKKKGWFKVCPEKWIHGSTREEMTSAERGVWIDFLALAFMNDPPGQIDFFTYKRLANQLNISVKLLDSTIKKAVFYKKIESKEEQLKPDFSKKDEKSSTTCAQLETKSDTLETNRLKIGLPLRSIIILEWNEYQNEYLRQKPYRQRKSAEEEKIEDEGEQNEKLQNYDPKSVTQVTDRGEERRKDYIRGEEREDSDSCSYPESEYPPSSNSPSPFSEGEKEAIDRLLSLLKDCIGYPYNELADGIVLAEALKKYPGINLELELIKKIDWWKENPNALKQKATPRSQLDKWFQKEYEFQNRSNY